MDKGKIFITRAVLILHICCHGMSSPIPSFTIHILKGSPKVNLPCTGLREEFRTVQWSYYDPERSYFDRILTYDYQDNSVKYYGKYEVLQEKYKVTVNSSCELVVTDTEVTDTDLFQCMGSNGYLQKDYSVVIRLQAVVEPLDDSVEMVRLKQEMCGPYDENTRERLFCRIKNILPGEENVTPSFSVAEKEAKIESKKSSKNIDDTMNVQFQVWHSFSKSDNGKSIKCAVDWRAGKYSKYVTDEVQDIDVRFDATNIKMSQKPSGYLPESSIEEFVCETDEANPSAEIEWNQKGKITAQVENGRYNAKLTKSKIKLQITKDMNGKDIICSVHGKADLVKSFTINVKGMQQPDPQAPDHPNMSLVSLQVHSVTTTTAMVTTFLEWITKVSHLNFTLKYRETRNGTFITDAFSRLQTGKDIEHKLINLKPEQEYEILITVDFEENGKPTTLQVKKVFRTASPPAQPLTIEISNVTSTSAVITWTTTHSEQMAWSYIVQYTEPSDRNLSKVIYGNIINEGNMHNKVEYQLTDLTPSTVYDTRILTYNPQTNNIETKTAIKQFKTSESSHRTFNIDTVQTALTTARIKWKVEDKPQIFVVHYQRKNEKKLDSIHDSSFMQGSHVGKTMEFDFEGLDPEQEYEVRVIGYNTENGQCESSSAVSTFQTLSPIFILPMNSTAAEITWVTTPTHIYKVDYRQKYPNRGKTTQHSKSFNSSAEIKGTEDGLIHIITGLKAGEVYEVLVSTKTDAGESWNPITAVKEFRTKSSIGIKVLNSTATQLSWVVTPCGWFLTDYVVQYRKKGHDLKNSTEIKGEMYQEINYILTELETGQIYEATVLSKNNITDSWQVITSMKEFRTYSEVSIQVISSTVAHVTWGAIHDDLHQFVCMVQYRVKNGTSFKKSSEINTKEYSLTGLEAGKIYEVRILSKGIANESWEAITALKEFRTWSDMWIGPLGSTTAEVIWFASPWMESRFIVQYWKNHEPMLRINHTVQAKSINTNAIYKLQGLKDDEVYKVRILGKGDSDKPEEAITSIKEFHTESSSLDRKDSIMITIICCLLVLVIALLIIIFTGICKHKVPEKLERETEDEKQHLTESQKLD